MNTTPLPKPAKIRRSHLLVLNTLSPKQSETHEKFASVAELVERMKPSEPVHALRPHVIRYAARWFQQAFPGQVMYAVKTNPDTKVLRWLSRAGIKQFDVASLQEIALVAREVPKADMHFMHPVKSREAIQKAYAQYKIKSFSLDSEQELVKIQEMTKHAQDLTLFVRIAIPNEHAAYSLQGKFGIALGEEAIELLRKTRAVANKLGICFHVGSQCMDPADYSKAMRRVWNLAHEAGVKLDALDIGGGFPSIYPQLNPPSLVEYMDEIRATKAELGIGEDVAFYSEPGRALVAEGGSVIVKVELRKGNALYLNDGCYGSLFDAGFPGFVFPTRAFRPHETLTGHLEPFSFFGPTCDSLDAMKGPFLLPSDIKEGDWIEIGGLGAYGATMRTQFNGFYSEKQAEVYDSPMLSMFGFK